MIESINYNKKVHSEEKSSDLIKEMYKEMESTKEASFPQTFVSVRSSISYRV